MVFEWGLGGVPTVRAALRSYNVSISEMLVKDRGRRSLRRRLRAAS